MVVLTARSAGLDATAPVRAAAATPAVGVPLLGALLRSLTRRPGPAAIRRLLHAVLVASGRDPAVRLEEEPEPALIGEDRCPLVLRHDLRPDRERDQAVAALDHLLAEPPAPGLRRCGLITDGARWLAYERHGTTMALLADWSTDPDRPDALLLNLEVLAGANTLLPADPVTVVRMLGRDSLAGRRILAQLRQAWTEAAEHPAARAQHDHWSDQITRVYGRPAATLGLFLQHTYLVLVARGIGRQIGAANLLGTNQFDWPASTAEGPALAATLARTLDRFQFDAVEADVLKGLYESLIDPDQRHELGEFYTPDWLADRICTEMLDRPLAQRVLDPSCGSGSFLFQAVRRYLTAARAAGWDPDRCLAGCLDQVIGIDIHPVAVQIARVTYCLALRPVLSTAVAPPGDRVAVPVHCADALGWTAPRLPAVFRATVIVGNPPWLAYRYLAPALQAQMREACRDLNLWRGGRWATQQDLAACFFARCCALYLAEGGRIAFVMPWAVFRLNQHQPLRTGDFGAVRVAYRPPWLLADDLRPLFGVPAMVLFAERAEIARPLPAHGLGLHGTLPRRDASPAEAATAITIRPFDDRAAAPGTTAGTPSPYRQRFRNGATLYPRLLCLVDVIGAPAEDSGCRTVRSRRSKLDKPPWATLDGLAGHVEAPFVRAVYCGSSLAPHRLLAPAAGVIPFGPTGLLNRADAAAAGWPQLAAWLGRAEQLWRRHGGGRHDFRDQIDHYHKLTGQFPFAPVRVLFAKSGGLPAAAVVQDPAGVVDHTLYWCAVDSLAEARYLAAVLNSEAVRRRVAGRQPRGQWGARHFDKLMLGLPIPGFDPRVDRHRALADLAEEAEQVAAAVPLRPNHSFVSARRAVRAALAAAGCSARIESLVEPLLEGC